jgi:uncharacterized protein (DUF362 family)
MDQSHDALTRRDFLLLAAAGGAMLAGLRAFSRLKRSLRVRGNAPSSLRKGLAVIHGSAAASGDEASVVRKMTRAAVDALGGMKALVRPGASVIIKPNAAWALPPQMAASTNPYVVAALVEMCREAGASRVKVIDHTIAANPEPSYRASGIAAEVERAGGTPAYVDPSRFVEIDVPDAFALSRWLFYEEFISADACDVLINVPVLKTHGTSRLTMGLKNAFGMVGGERGNLHRDIHRNIADLHRVVKVDLTVLDAYRVMRRHGPTGGRLEDVDNSMDGARRIIAGTDPVAVDAYGASLFGWTKDDVSFVRYAEEAGIGSADWQAALVYDGGT